MGAVLSEQALVTKNDLLAFSQTFDADRQENDKDELLMIETQQFSEADAEPLLQPNKQLVQLLTPRMSPLNQLRERRTFTDMAHEMQTEIYQKQFRTLTADTLNIANVQKLAEYQLGAELVRRAFLDVTDQNDEMNMAQFVQFKQLCYVINKARYYENWNQKLSFVQICKLLKLKQSDLAAVFEKMKLKKDQLIKFKDLYFVARKLKQLRLMRKAAVCFQQEDVCGDELITYDQVRDSLAKFGCSRKNMNKLLKYVDDVESGFLTLKSY